MTGARRAAALAPLLVAVLAAPVNMGVSGCGKSACKVLKAASGDAAGVVKLVVGLLLPHVAPSAAQQFNEYSAAAEVTTKPLLGLCDTGEPPPVEQLRDAVEANLRLLHWYEANKPTPEQAEESLRARGMPVPRDLRDADPVEEMAGTAVAVAARQIPATIADLTELLARIETRGAERAGE